jgi:hypothetical protein
MRRRAAFQPAFSYGHTKITHHRMPPFFDVQLWAGRESRFAVSRGRCHLRKGHQAVDDGKLFGDEDKLVSLGDVCLEGLKCSARDCGQSFLVLLALFRTDNQLHSLADYSLDHPHAQHVWRMISYHRLGSDSKLSFLYRFLDLLADSNPFVGNRLGIAYRHLYQILLVSYKRSMTYLNACHCYIS